MVVEFIRTLVFYLAFTAVFLNLVFIKHRSVCPLFNVHLLWYRKCQIPVLNKGDLFVCKVLHDDN